MTIRIFRPVHETRFQVAGMPRPREGEPTNKDWFKEITGRPIRPTWISGPNGWDGYWVIARQHMTLVAEELALRYGTVHVTAEYSTLEKCDTRCQNATGDDCQCSCLGVRHGEALQASWKQVGATTLVRSAGIAIVERVLTSTDVWQGRGM